MFQITRLNAQKPPDLDGFAGELRFEQELRRAH